MSLVVIQAIGATPSPEAAAKQLGVGVDDIDLDFGVVPIDPKRGLYSVRVAADRLPADFGERQPYQGPFSDPPIMPFGPVENKKKNRD